MSTYDAETDPEIVQPAHLSLGEVIAALEDQPAERVVPVGFGKPDSYRGYYEQLAFAPAKNVTVGSMLAHARSALGATFEGWKGGDYAMDAMTPCWVAHRGHSDGETIGRTLLTLMLKAGAP